MLELHIPGEERWDERTNMFVYDEPVTLRLEYSLLSLSKWESKWHNCSESHCNGGGVNQREHVSAGEDQ